MEAVENRKKNADKEILFFLDVVLMGRMEGIIQKQARNWKTSKGQMLAHGIMKCRE